ncbi:MAG: MBL fold metallo-hydrolase [Agathobaculum desmolans]|uniref:MBL fold metallo-hydrolase n=1 Tax=Agathobaculum desmolans TaxID=39484 RepID=UPI00399640F3
MGLTQLTNRIYFLEHDPEADRPMLAYLKGDKFSLAINAGYSASHVQDFYRAIAAEQLDKPDFTVITHWHYDHTFGMHAISGISIAHDKTNAFLKNQQALAENPGYIESLKKEDAYFRKEYCGQKQLNIALSDISFSDNITLDLGGITAQIFHTVSPHATDTVCVYVPEEKALFLGDATSEDFFNHGYMDTNKLHSLMQTIRTIDCRHCMLSHCEPLGREDLLAYLQSLYS